MRHVALAALLLAAPACAADSSSAVADPCQAAADHLAACHGQPAAPVSECDEDQARAVLTRSCDQLGVALDDTKADSWDASLAGFGCSLGLYRYCPEVACDAAADERDFVTAPSPAPEGLSACAVAALEHQGCGACDYYRCREATARCGPEGYLTRFALRYCERYRLVSEPEASPAARAFLERVRRCLIVRFDQGVDRESCDAMQQRGFESHPPCYVEAGFCDLAVSDWLLVLATIDAGDASFSQMLTTGVLCLREWFDG